MHTYYNLWNITDINTIVAEETYWYVNTIHYVNLNLFRLKQKQFELWWSRVLNIKLKQQLCIWLEKIQNNVKMLNEIENINFLNFSEKGSLSVVILLDNWRKYFLIDIFLLSSKYENRTQVGFSWYVDVSNRGPYFHE